jgi:mRNA interferase RelE/StbE
MKDNNKELPPSAALMQMITETSRSRIKRLRGLRHPQYRLRVDDLRIFYDVEKDKVEILAIILKSKAAEWLKKVGEGT